MLMGNTQALKSHSASDSDATAPSGSNKEEKQKGGGKIKATDLLTRPGLFPVFQLWVLRHRHLPAAHTVQGLPLTPKGLGC